MTAVAVDHQGPTLAAALGLTATRARSAILILCTVAATALSAQVRFYLPWTPVPVTGQTFAVLFASAVLGARLASTSMVAYIGLGVLGAPVFADGEGGWSVASGSTAGYLIGFILAAALVGKLADERQDRSLLTCLPAMTAGSALIYATGALWLSWHLKISASESIELGVTPFLIGDGLKLIAAGLIVPGAWRALARHRRS